MAERADPDFYSEWLDSHFARDVQQLFGVAKRSADTSRCCKSSCARAAGGLLAYTRLARDTGFVCHARGWDQLPPDDCGSLWEHLVLDTLLSVEDPAKVLCWRDHQQREVDFVVPRGWERVDAYECKWSTMNHDLKNLRAFRVRIPEAATSLSCRRSGHPPPFVWRAWRWSWSLHPILIQSLQKPPLPDEPAKER